MGKQLFNNNPHPNADFWGGNFLIVNATIGPPLCKTIGIQVEHNLHLKIKQHK